MSLTRKCLKHAGLFILFSLLALLLTGCGVPKLTVHETQRYLSDKYHQEFIVEKETIQSMTPGWPYFGGPTSWTIVAHPKEDPSTRFIVTKLKNDNSNQIEFSDDYQTLLAQKLRERDVSAIVRAEIPQATVSWSLYAEKLLGIKATWKPSDGFQAYVALTHCSTHVDISLPLEDLIRADEFKPHMRRIREALEGAGLTSGSNEITLYEEDAYAESQAYDEEHLGGPTWLGPTSSAYGTMRWGDTLDSPQYLYFERNDDLELVHGTGSSVITAILQEEFPGALVRWDLSYLRDDNAANAWNRSEGITAFLRSDNGVVSEIVVGLSSEQLIAASSPDVQARIAQKIHDAGLDVFSRDVENYNANFLGFLPIDELQQYPEVAAVGWRYSLGWDVNGDDESIINMTFPDPDDTDSY